MLDSSTYHLVQMKVRSYLALIVAAAILPVIGVAAWGLNVLLEKERDAALRGARETVRATALLIDQELSNAQTALNVLGTSQALVQGNLPAFYQRARDAVNKASTWIVLFDREGQQLINTQVPFGTPLPKRANPQNGWEIMQTRQSRVTGLVKGAIRNNYVVALDSPVPVGGGQKYTISQAFTPDYFNQVITAQPVPSEWMLAIVDRAGNTLARSHDADKFIGMPTIPQLRQAMESEDEGMLRTSSLNGVEVYALFTKSSISGWTVALGVPAKEIDASAAQAVLILALGLLLALASGALAAAYFGKRLVRSIQFVEASAAALGRGTQPRPAATDVKEVDGLNEALIRAGELLTAERQTRIRTEAELKTVLASEKDAREIAQEQNRAKDEFLAMLGHELRNPLAPISAASEILARAPDANEKIRQASQVIGRQVRHMTQLINDLLDVSRVTRGLVAIDKQAQDLRVAIQNAVEQIRPLMDNQGHRFQIDLPASPVRVLGDQKRLVQIVSNILHNAVKYTPPGGEIRLKLTCSGERASISIKDNGIGIAPDMHGSVFDLFVQGKRGPDRTQGGLGIGLALVRSLVGLHGGSVTCASPGTGAGSEFIISLPLLPESGMADIHQTDMTVPDRTSLHILLVDDNIDAAAMLQHYLEMRGHRVDVAHTAKSALTRAQAEAYDVFLLDIGLPDIDGYELARRLRADARSSDAVLIAVTGYGQHKDRQDALQAGFDYHFVKPVESEALLACLNKAGK